MNTIRIQFDRDNLPQVGDNFTFADALSGAPFGGNYGMEIVADINTPPSFEFAPVPVSASISALLTSVVNSFNSAYNQGLLYSVVANFSQDYVDVTAFNSLSVFSVVSNNTTGRVVLTPDNAVIEVDFSLVSYAVSENATDPCNLFDISIETTLQADEVTQPIQQALAQNPFILTLSREDESNIVVTKEVDLVTYSETIRIRVPKLLPAYFDVTTIVTPFGSSVQVDLTEVYQLSRRFPMLLIFEYSFDNGATWGASNSQSGLSSGAYTVLIRDNIGCQISIDFSIVEFDGQANLVDYDPIAEVSKVNPLNFKKVVSWDSCTTPRVVSNTLSYEERSQINSRNFVQNFQTCDTIMTQVKSNYDVISAKLVACGQLEADGTVLNTLKKTTNMNNVDIRDCYTGYSDGFLTVRFVSGNTYDSGGAVTGSYNLGVELPSWINEGDYLFLETHGWVFVDSIIAPTDFANYYLIKTTTIISFVDAFGTKKCTTYYNTVNYERYEFTLPANAFSAGEYYVSLEMSAPQSGFETVNFRSEWIFIQEAYEERHHIIDYYNSEGTDVNYATGVRFRLRIPYLRDLKWLPTTEQDVYVTDTKSVTIENTARDLYILSAYPLPTAMAQKLMLALSQDKLMIDGETYVLEGEIESSPMGSSNLYAIKATVSKSDYVFSSAGGLTAGDILIPSESPIEIDDNANGLLLI